MHRITSAIILGGYLLSASALADAPLACVDRDIVNALLRCGLEGPASVTTGWPDAAPQLALPEGFSFIGARAGEHRNTLAFRADTSPDEARIQFVKAMRADGWKVTLDSETRRGFRKRDRSEPDDGVFFCHAGVGRVHSRYLSADRGETYVIVDAFTPRQDESCEQRRPPIATLDESSVAPALYLPDGASGWTGGGYGSTDYGASVGRIESQQSAEQLLTWFGTQLTEQNWHIQTQWVGARASGSTWLSKDEDLSGQLSIVRQKDNWYHLSFEVVDLK